MAEDTRKCAFPGCTETFTGGAHNRRYHDPRERNVMANRRYDASPAGRARRLRYIRTPKGHAAHYESCRTWQLRDMRARITEQLAALQGKEQ